MAAKKTAAKSSAGTKPTPKKTAQKATAKPRVAKKPAPAPKKPAGSLEVSHVLTLNSRAAYDALSAGDRAQFGALASSFGQKDAAAMFAWCAKEGMGFFKLALLRGGAPAWEVWINTAMDDGLVFAPGADTSAQFGISQGGVEDIEDGRRSECTAIERALGRFHLPPGKKLEDIFWQRGA
jgi:hypothetical protein